MLIEIQGLKLNLGGRPILRGVNLCLQKGEIYGLLGPNGAGKSTTISVITGLRKSSEGTIRILGLDPAAEVLQLHRRIGVLAEEAGFYDWMNASDYLQWVAALYGVPREVFSANQLLEQVGLDNTSRASISTYSRGMRQRLGMARALINRPELLILDEPTNGLDPQGRREIHDILLDLSRNHGVGILLCTHLLDDVDRLCSRIGIISRGESLLEGDITDLLSTQRAAARYRLRVGSDALPSSLPVDVSLLAVAGNWWHVRIENLVEPAEIWRKLFDAGINIAEIHREGGGLGELYMSVTISKEAAR